MEVGGAPVQASAPDTTATDQVVVDDLVVSLTWNSEPLAEYESSWNVHITEADGTPVEGGVVIIPLSWRLPAE